MRTCSLSSQAAKFLAFALICAATPALQSAQAQTQLQPLDQFPRAPLTIATSKGRVHTFNVWLAETEPRRTQGLTFVRTIADDMGMLITCDTPRPMTLTMKDTLISLDIVFIRADGRIARIVTNSTPLSLIRIESGEPVLAALELKSGTIARLHIERGAQVIHPLFRTRK
jgi:uncharacterized membrane protein (UPF0127 family)